MEIITNVEKEMRDKVSLGYDLLNREYEQFFSRQPIGWITLDDARKTGFSHLKELISLYIEDLLDEVDDANSVNTKSVHGFDEFIIKGILAAFDGKISEDTEIEDLMLMEDKDFSDLSKVTLFSHMEEISISNPATSKLYYDLSKEYFKGQNLMNLLIFKKRFLRHLSVNGFNELRNLFNQKGAKEVIKMIEEETPFLLNHSQIISEKGYWADIDLHDGRINYSILGVFLKSEHEFNHVTWVILELLLGFEEHKIYPSPELVKIISSAYSDYFCATEDVTLDVYEDHLVTDFRERRFVFMDDFDIFVTPTIELQALILEQYGDNALKQVRLSTGEKLPTVIIPDESGDNYREFSFKEKDKHFVIYLDGDVEDFMIVPKADHDEFTYEEFLRNLMPFV